MVELKAKFAESGRRRQDIFETLTVLGRQSDLSVWIGPDLTVPLLDLVHLHRVIS